MQPAPMMVAAVSAARAAATSTTRRGVCSRLGLERSGC